MSKYFRLDVSLFIESTPKKDEEENPSATFITYEREWKRDVTHRHRPHGEPHSSPVSRIELQKYRLLLACESVRCRTSNGAFPAVAMNLEEANGVAMVAATAVAMYSH